MPYGSNFLSDDTYSIIRCIYEFTFISANKDTLFPLLSQTNDFKNVLCPDTLP